MAKLGIWRSDLVKFKDLAKCIFGQIYGFGEIILAKLEGFGEMDLAKDLANGFGEIILAKLGIWRSDLVKFKDLAKVFWPNLWIW